LPSSIAQRRCNDLAANRANRKGPYAIVNPSASQPSTVFLSLFDTGGHFVASGSVQIPPQGRLSRFLHEFLPDAPSDFMGSLRITSAIPIAFGGVNILYPEGKFTGINVAFSAAVVCIQVVAPARNPLTNECRVFPTPCDIPDGWLPTAYCL